MKIDSQLLTDKEKIVSLFEAQEAHAWMPSLRRNAISRFVELDYPRLKNEDWKYTSVEPILQTPFEMVQKEQSGGVSSEQIDKLALGCKHLLVFIDGIFSRELSRLSALPQGIKLMNLAAAWSSDAAVIEKHLTKYAAFDRNAFAALNTAFMRDGVFLHVAANQKIKDPVHLMFLSQGQKFLSQPHNLMVAEAGSEVTIVESHVCLKPGAYFTNMVSEFVINEGAKADYFRIQKESPNAFHLSTTEVSLNKNSHFNSFFFDSGAKLARNNFNVNFNAEGGQACLNGLYLATDEQHIDNTTVIDHSQPGCESRQLYKGILDKKASAVFSGKIYVRRGAQKTDAAQKNKNLLLSEKTKVDTRPQLEIFADDVKCAHGAAVGQLDAEQIFYLKSRGMDEETARQVLTYGFANEVIEKVSFAPLHQELEKFLVTRLQMEHEA